MNTRPRGTTATEIPADKLAAAIAAHAGIDPQDVAAEQTWLIDRGQGEGPRYAITNTEGVTHIPAAGKPFEVYTDWRDGLYAVSVEALVAAAEGGEAWDLADVVRTFGGRLEANFYGLRRWITRQD